MKIEYLSEFLVLCETMNYTKAAKELFISQPVLSTHIQNLEKELGAMLIERSDGRMRLTRCGETLLRDAPAVIGQYRRMVEDIQAKKDGLAESVRVGFLRHSFAAAVKDTAKALKRQAPDTQISLRSGGYVEIMRALAENEIDVAFTVDVDDTARETRNVEYLGTERVVLAAPKGLLPATAVEEGFVRTDDANACPVLVPASTETGKYAAWLKVRLGEVGIKSSIFGTFLDPELRDFEMTTKGCGCFLMEDFAKDLDRGSFDVLPIGSLEGEISIDLIAVWKRSNRSSIVETVVSMTKERMRQEAIAENLRERRL